MFVIKLNNIIIATFSLKYEDIGLVIGLPVFQVKIRSTSTRVFLTQATANNKIICDLNIVTAEGAVTIKDITSPYLNRLTELSGDLHPNLEEDIFQDILAGLSELIERTN